MVDDETQYEDGPHFSIEFVTSGLGIVGNVFSLIGIFLYKQYMKDWKYRYLIMVSNLLTVAKQTTFRTAVRLS